MKNIQDILKNYDSQPPAVRAKLYGMLNHGALSGTGKLMILPVDQGFEHGPSKSFSKNPSAYSPEYHIELAIASGASAFAAPLGFIESVAHKYVGQIPLILKINNSDSLYKNSKAPIPAVTSSVSEALRLGCSAIGFTIYPSSSERKSQYEELAQASNLAKEAGLAVVVWSYPRGEGLSTEGETAVDVVAYAAHIACQLGAHIVKVKPPTAHVEKEKSLFEKENISSKTLSDRTAHVIQSAFNGQRIVIFSGGPAKQTEDFLNEIKELKQGGAFGSIIGRNAFQRSKKEALDLLKSVVQIYKS